MTTIEEGSENKSEWIASIEEIASYIIYKTSDHDVREAAEAIIAACKYREGFIQPKDFSLPEKDTETDLP